MAFDAALIVSLPPGEVEIYRNEIMRWRPGIILTPALIEGVFRERAKTILGPAFVGYADENIFRPVYPSGARLLTAADKKAFGVLRNACLAKEWDHGGSTFRPNHMVGVLRDQQLVTVASYKLWGEHIAHISIITHPSFRGRGHATTAVSELTRIVLERKLVPQYRTLKANVPSMTVAKKLRFLQYATSMLARFREASRSTTRVAGN